MTTRREVLIAVAAALAGCSGSDNTPRVSAGAPAKSDASKQLASVLDRMFEEKLDHSPATVTRLSMDKDARATAKSQLDDVSPSAMERNKTLTKEQLARLTAIDRSALTGSDAINYDIVKYLLDADSARLQRFSYGSSQGTLPYVVSQLTGAYAAVPGLLQEEHVIETKADVDAYLERLSSFSNALDQETDCIRRDAALGVIPPDFVVDRTLLQMNVLLTKPEASILVTSLVERAKAKAIAGDHEANAARIYAERVVPALNRQIDYLKDLRKRAGHDAGVWRLPDGEAYYAASLKSMNTVDLPAEDIHRIGLEQVKELTARADTLLKAQGHTRGTVGERIKALSRDAKFLYPNTDAGRATLIADLTSQIENMNARLPEYFGALPPPKVEVRRVPEYIEKGGPAGAYSPAALDGSRPANFWINLRDTFEHPRWALRTLTYHEVVPGHHIQHGLQREAALPKLRLLVGFSAYSEGWAHYAEQLAMEMGVYADDPLSELGYLQAALFRAGRLVVDTGLHFKRWSREQAIDTMVSINGSTVSGATTEIERYCVVPGNACSYLVGKLTFLRLREQAKAKLGERFDIRKFHDTVLLNGSMPLGVLETVVNQSVQSA